MPVTLNKVRGKCRSSHDKSVKPYPQPTSESSIHENYPCKNLQINFENSNRRPLSITVAFRRHSPRPFFLRPSVSNSRRYEWLTVVLSVHRHKICPLKSHSSFFLVKISWIGGSNVVFSAFTSFRASSATVRPRSLLAHFRGGLGSKWPVDGSPVVEQFCDLFYLRTFLSISTKFQGIGWCEKRN